MPASLLLPDDKATIKAAQPKSNHKILTATVARLFVAYPDKSRWTYTHLFGGILLVKDLHNGASFLRIIDMSGGSGRRVLWEQELYEGFDFVQQKPFFFSFAGDEHVFGLDFADVGEAAEFAKKVWGRTPKLGRKTSAARVPASPAARGSGPSATQRILRLDNAKYRELVRVLASYSIAEDMLDDPDTAKFIQKFVSQNGGVDNMTRSASSAAPT
ncbi:hypothetical protein EC988_002496, partial [Linderina pennispora]